MLSTNIMEDSQNYEIVDAPSCSNKTISTDGKSPSGGINYEIVDNPSYAVRNKTILTDGNTHEVYYSAVGKTVPPNSSPAGNEPVTKTPWKINKCTVAAIIAVCTVTVVLLAVGSIVLVNIEGNSQMKIAKFTQELNATQSQLLVNMEVNSDMQVKIAKLTQELNATQSQLNEILMGVNQTGNNTITTVMIAGKNEDQQLDPSYHVAGIPRSQWRV